MFIHLYCNSIAVDESNTMKVCELNKKTAFIKVYFFLYKHYINCLINHPMKPPF